MLEVRNVHVCDIPEYLILPHMAIHSFSHGIFPCIPTPQINIFV
jgi:hypothetical protein